MKEVYAIQTTFDDESYIEGCFARWRTHCVFESKSDAEESLKAHISASGYVAPKGMKSRVYPLNLFEVQK